MYVRTGRRMVRRVGRSNRNSSQWHWVDYSLDADVLSTAAVAHPMDLNLSGDYSARKDGAVIERIVGDINAVPIVAPGAGTADYITVGFVMANSNTPSSFLDPTVANGRILKWIHQENWFEGYLAAAGAGVNGYVSESRRHIDVRVRRKYRDQQDQLWWGAGVSNATATQQWRVQAHLRILIRVP